MRISALIVSILCLAACGRSPQPLYYALDADRETGGGSEEASIAPAEHVRGRVVLSAVFLPAYLDRDEIVTRRAEAARVDIAEYRLWAEPLDKAVPRVLEETMRPVLRENYLELLWPERSTDADAAVEVKILRFDAVPGGEAVLAARWRIVNKEGKHFAAGLFAQAESVGSAYEDIAGGMRLLAGEFGRKLGQEAVAAIEYRDRERKVFFRSAKRKSVSTD